MSEQPPPYLTGRAADSALADSVRVLHRLVTRDHYGIVPADQCRYGLIVDVETTGLDRQSDKIIQLAAIKFEFAPDGTIGRVVESYVGLEDPGVPLSPEIIEVTGLTDADLSGKRLDELAIAHLLENVVLVIAHNAEFDRQVIERRVPGFDTVRWACSMRDVRWDKHGIRGGSGLEFLLFKACDLFYDAHDALEDCRATLHLLATARLSATSLPPVEIKRPSAFVLLLESVREGVVRVWAWNSAYETKDRLKARRYRWWPAPTKCWAKDIRPDELEAERAWLVQHIYTGRGSGYRGESPYMNEGEFDPSPAEDLSEVTKISAFDRYSIRAEPE